jgi:hypothetical protein
MKTLVKLLLVAALLPVAGFAQNNPLNSFIKKYQDQPGFYYLDLKTNMMSDEPEKVINLKLLSFDEKDNSSFMAKNLYNDFFNKVDKNEYKGLVEVKSSGDNVEMLVKKEGEKISEIIIAVQGDKETVLISASGSFSMKDLGKFSNLKECKGLQVLEQLCEE